MTTATLTAPRRQPPPEPPPHAARPQRAAELELLGRFEGSGFKKPPYLARRRDGQIVQLSRLLYLVADAADGHRDEQAIAAHLGPRIGRRVSADNVAFLIERKLRPLGVVAAADGSTPELPKRPALLALRHRRPLLPARVVRRLGAAFAPLFAPPVIFLVLAALGAFDVWLFGLHGVAPGLRAVLYEPTLLLGLVLCVVAATAFHEVGHAAACRYGGAQPGVIGAGLYLVWPAFYCDVTEAYRLGRRGRLRTDLGGIYFNAIVCLLAGGAYFATGQEPLLLLAVVQHIMMAQQLIPLMRFDGYYVLTDLTGVPDILSRIGPILRSLVPFRPPESKVRELKPWVRVAVTLYIALLVPVLTMMLSWMAIGAPRVFATAFDSVGMHVARVSEMFRRGEWSLTALSCLQVAALVLQCAGITLVMGRTGKSAVRRLKRWSSGSAPRKVVAVAGSGAVLCALLVIWWPSGEYRPLVPGERGTIPEAVAALPQVSQRRVFTEVPGAGVREAGAAPMTSAGQTSTEPVAAAGAPIDQRTETSSGDDRHAALPDDASPPPDSPESTAPAPTPAAPAAPDAPPAAEPTPTPTPTPPSTDNAAIATNRVDGSLVFRLAFDLQFIVGDGELEQSNTAIAQATCEGCRTIAVAIQVLIATGSFDVIQPTNVAIALNEVCSSCETLAYAYQLLLMTPDPRYLTEQGRNKLAAILAAIVVLGSSDVPIQELRADLDALMVGVRNVMGTELVPSAPPEQTAPAEATSTPAPSPTAAAQQESQTPVPEQTQTPTPEPTATPSPDPTGTPSPDPTATPSPDPTATSTPDATATATATPTP